MLCYGKVWCQYNISGQQQCPVPRRGEIRLYARSSPRAMSWKTWDEGCNNVRIGDCEFRQRIRGSVEMGKELKSCENHSIASLLDQIGEGDSERRWEANLLPTKLALSKCSANGPVVARPPLPLWLLQRLQLIGRCRIENYLTISVECLGRWSTDSSKSQGCRNIWWEIWEN